MNSLNITDLAREQLAVAVAAPTRSMEAMITSCDKPWWRWLPDACSMSTRVPRRRL